MNNSIFQSFGAQQNPFSQLISEVNNFKKSFNGDPRAEVERMLKSGQLSQEQFNQYAQIANELVKYMR